MPQPSLVQDALNASANSQNLAAKHQDRLTQILQEMGVLGGTVTSATDRATASTNVIEQQALKGAQQSQDATLASARAAGVDNSNPADILVGLGEELRKNIELAKAARANIDAKQSINPLDNPLGWLHAQLTVEQDQANYNNSMQSAAGINKNIASVTSAVDEIARTRAALTVKITDATRAAAADVRIAQGEAEKANAQRGYLKDEMVVAGAIQNASAAQAQEVQRQLGIVANAEQQEMEREKFRMYKEQYNWELQSKKLNSAAKQEAEDIKKQLLLQLNIGAEVLGMPKYSSWELAKAKAELGGTEGARISAMMEAGGNTIAAGGRPVAAATPGGAANMINSRVYARADDAGFASMKKYLKEQYNLELINQGGKADKAVLAVNMNIAEAAKRFEKDATTTGSFYATPPLASILSTKSVQSTALYKKVLASAGKDLTTAAPTPIIDLAYSAAKQKIISYEEAAAGIAEVYAQAVNINNSEKRFAQIGIPSQKSFKTKPDIPGRDITVDLTNYTEVLHMMATKKAGEVRVTTGGRVLFGGVL